MLNNIFNTLKDMETFIQQDTSFIEKVSMGMLPGFSYMSKYGVNKEITKSSFPEDVCEQGGQYIYDAKNTAPIKYICSSDPLDSGKEIEIKGLDINGDEVTQKATLDGQNNVELTTHLYRNYRMKNRSNGLDILGTVYCHTDDAPTNGVPVPDKIRAIIDGANNKTLMALYTVPKGKVAFWYKFEVGVELEGNTGALAEYARSHFEVRPLDEVFSCEKSVTTMIGGNPIYSDERVFKSAITALSDIRIRVIEVSETMGVWGTFDLLLVDEDLFSDEYLASIEQPGY